MKLLLPVTALALLSATVSSRAVEARELQLQAGKANLHAIAQLEHPWAIAVLPDGSMLVTEKVGRVRRVVGDQVSAPIAGVPPVAFQGQGGLLGLTLDPDFASNATLYLTYAELASEVGSRQNQQPASAATKGLAVARAKLDGNALKELQVIWRQEPKTEGHGHFGGRMAFASDGTLFITSGERQRFHPAQDMGSDLGKIIRINKDGTIPADNPFANAQQGRAGIWSLGHRNPLGIAFEPGTGQLWAHEMGPKGGDEVNIVLKGANYGWPQVSNGDHYDGTAIPRHASNAAFQQPTRSWNPSISPSGLLFYTGDLFPQWKGKALLGGLSSQSLFVLTTADGGVTEHERIAMQMRIRDVAQAKDGSLLLLSDGPQGALLRLTPLKDSATR